VLVLDMFSLITTSCYMLAAYIAFLIGSSPKLSVWLIIFIPACFVIGYLLDRMPAVQQMVAVRPNQIPRILISRYLLFIPVTALFFALGMGFEYWQL